jgi:Na+-driven multidrug efflux pump
LEEQIVVPTILIIILFVHFFLRSFGGIFVTFLNGISNLKLQLIFSFIGSLIFIPLTYFLIHFLQLGLVGLVVSIIISNFYGPFIAPIQAIGIIKRGKQL